MSSRRQLVWIALFLFLPGSLFAHSSTDPQKALRLSLQAELEELPASGWKPDDSKTTWGPALTEYRSRLARIAGQEDFLRHHRMGTIPWTRKDGPTEALGINLFWPQGRQRGTILFVHGYMSHAANFAYTLAFFVQRGWAVVTVDLPGHGLSTGPRADVSSFADYGAAVQTWMDWVWKTALPGPRVLIAHSLGTAASLEALRKPGAKSFEQIIFCAPLLRTDWFPLLSFGASSLGPWFQYVPSTFGWDGYLDGYAMPLHWLRALSLWLEGLKTQGPLALPLTIYSGDHDEIVDEGWNQNEYRRLVPEAKYYMLPGKGHLFLSNQEDRVAFHLTIAATLDLTLPPPLE